MHAEYQAVMYSLLVLYSSYTGTLQSRVSQCKIKLMTSSTNVLIK